MLYLISGQWLAWLLLVGVLALPLLSLVLSIPALRSFRLAPTGGDSAEMGEDIRLWLLGSCAVPMPPFRGEIQMQHSFSGEKFRYRPDKGADTRHCGSWKINIHGARVCDYLGLFALRPRYLEGLTLTVRPAPVPVPGEPDLEKFTALRWHPKPGGGCAENHELRDYRPGDAMNGVHWKLSAKTGELVVREPMEPEQQLLLLTLDLRGTPEELDRKLGRLLWLGQVLLDRGLHFRIRALTGSGLLDLPVSGETELNRQLDALLCQKPCTEGSVLEHPLPAFWQYHIGGEPDEA